MLSMEGERETPDLAEKVEVLRVRRKGKGWSET